MNEGEGRNGRIGVEREKERNANLPIGIKAAGDDAAQEIGVPGGVAGSVGMGIARNANLPIGIKAGGKDADQEIGVPGGASSSPWHSRGYLPHFDGQEAVQHVTFHLADSLPKETLVRLQAEVEHLSEDERKREMTVRLQDWMDRGHGSCVLREPEIAAMMEGVLRFFANERYTLFEWVVMPNHVHVLFKPLQEWKVSHIVASWKKFSARKILEWTAHGNDRRNANLPIGSFPSGVWHREYWDRFMRDEAHFHRAASYIRDNPVKAKLVERAEEWRWGSAYRKADQEIGVPELKKSLLHQAFEGDL